MSEWFKPRVPLIFNNESISPYGSLNDDNGFQKSFVKQFSKKGCETQPFF